CFSWARPGSTTHASPLSSAGAVVGIACGLGIDVGWHDATAAFVASSAGGAPRCSAASWASTGRNRSSAVRPTSRFALSRSFTPGRSMTMLLPSRVTSASETPSPLTRRSMMFLAVSSELLAGLPGRDSRTGMPPWRSRPGTGMLPAATGAPSAITTTDTLPMRYTQYFRTSALAVAELVGVVVRAVGLRLDALGDRAPRHSEDHAGSHLEVDRPVVEDSDGAVDPARRHDLVSDPQAGHQRPVRGHLPPLRAHDQQEERGDENAEIEEGYGHRV